MTLEVTTCVLGGKDETFSVTQDLSEHGDTSCVLDAPGRGDAKGGG